MYHSVPGKCPWALKHILWFRPTWVLTQDINCIHLYGSKLLHLPFEIWYVGAYPLARDTMVYYQHFFPPSLHAAWVSCLFLVPQSQWLGGPSPRSSVLPGCRSGRYSEYNYDNYRPIMLNFVIFPLNISRASSLGPLSQLFDVARRKACSIENWEWAWRQGYLQQRFPTH